MAFTDLGHNRGMAPASSPDSRALPAAEAKAAWRAAVRQARAQRGDRRNAEHAVTFRDAVLALPEAQGVRRASVYAARAHEPRTLPLIDALTDAGVEVLIPCLGEGLQRGWAVYRNAEDLVERAPGRPPEPSGDFLPQAELADAELIVVPALGADSRGTRLGQGAGWYDRTLTDAHKDATIVALVFDDEYHDAEEHPVPREPHDMSVDIVVTPSGTHRIAG